MRNLFSNIVGVLTVASILAPFKIVQAADFLLIPDSFSDRVLLFDAFDGSLVDDNFIDGAGLFQTPINAIQVNNEVWVSDQLADSIFRFDLQGQLLSTIAGGLDNIRGLEFINNQVYVTNAGTDNGAPGAGIVTFDTTGNNTGFFATGNPFDVFANGGELLISNIADNNLDRYDLGGSFLGTLHDSDGVNGISFPQQINARDNNLLVGGFSTPAGIYEYAPDGTQIGRFTSAQGVADRGIRGVYELGNGNVLWTGGDGVVSTNLTTGSPGFGTFTDIYTRQTLGCTTACVSTRFIEPISLDVPPVPEPNSLLSILTLGLFGAGSAIKRK